MRRFIVWFVPVLAALGCPLDAQANGATWTMPYSGVCIGNQSCFNIMSDNQGILVNALNVGVNVIGNPAVVASGNDGSAAGILARSHAGYGVESQGFVGVRGAGVIGLQGSGVTFGLEVDGVTSPIRLNGTVPSVPQNPLCKSTAGSAAGHIGFCSSTRALKDGITDLDMGTATLMRLRPVAFRWKSNNSEDLGFVAEDVAKVNRLLAVYNENGQLQSVKYTQMTALLTKVLQEQVRERTKVEDGLRKQVSQLQRDNADLAKELHTQQDLIKSLASRLTAMEQRAARSAH